MDIEYAVEQSPTMLVEAYNLAKAHYEEVEAKSSSVPFKLDLSYMSELVKAGMIFAVTARHMGEMVGYFGISIVPDFITQMPAAKEVGIYVDPAFRGEGIYQKMLEMAEAASDERDAYCLILAFKEGHDTGQVVDFGYERTETLYQKLL